MFHHWKFLSQMIVTVTLIIYIYSASWCCLLWFLLIYLNNVWWWWRLYLVLLLVMIYAGNCCYLLLLVFYLSGVTYHGSIATLMPHIFDSFMAAITVHFWLLLHILVLRKLFLMMFCYMMLIYITDSVLAVYHCWFLPLLKNQIFQ